MISDENYIRYFKSLALMNKPIDFYGKKIYIPLVEEVLGMREDRFNKLLLPFVHNKKSLSIDIEEVGLLDIYESLTQQQLANGHSDNLFIDFVVDSIKMFFKTDSVDVINMGTIEVVVDRDLFIDSNKFNELKEIILLICKLKELDAPKKSDIEVKLEKITDIREREYQRRILENKQKEENIDDLQSKLYNIYNNVVLLTGGLSYEKVSKLNIYQLYNTHKGLGILNNIKFDKDIYVSSISNYEVDLKKYKIKNLLEEIIE